MKSLPSALQDHLGSGATTLAWCWKLTRRDGRSIGFTDHDRDIVMDSITYESTSGFTASEIKDTLGLAVDNLDVAAALSSSRLDEGELAAGLYDEAAVEIWRVNWMDPEQRVLMRRGSIGEVRRSGASFSAEIRGLAHYLNQPKGRLYQYTCDAVLGDARCGVALLTPAYAATVTVSIVLSPRRATVTGVESFEGGWFSRGLAQITSGLNAGQRVEVRRHSVATGTVLEFWQELPYPLAVGDTITITAGCDKHFSTCRDKFANAENFRGFPHMPADRLLTTPARPGEAHDGERLR